MRPRAGRAVALAVLIAAAGCTVGPDYHRPSAPVPARYKEARPIAGWKRGQPADAIPRGAWWRIYRDPVLDGLERRVDISNQNLKAAAAAFRQSEAIVAESRSGFFPTLSASGAAQRSRGGGRGGGNLAGFGGGGSISNFFNALESASWVPDLWGRVRRTVESSVASAQASAGDLAGARLSAQSALAADYLQLRVADDLRRLLDQTVAAYGQSLRIAQNQYAAGIAAASDVAQAKAQLENAKAQRVAVGVTRARLEHAMAVLIGEPPADLTIAPVARVNAVPEIPSEVPATLLERRPDIAAAERRMAAANARIGAAEAAFFPDLTLTGDSGTSASTLAGLGDAASRLWSFGGQLVETIFEGGARHAQVDAARAAYDQTVAQYRQTVLAAFQQVEDELAALRLLARQQRAADAALSAAREAARTITNQYRAGTVAYTNVVVAQTTALADAESALAIRQNRLTASVALIEAMGGGWSGKELPGRQRIERDVPLNFSPLPPADAFGKQ